ncbi:MAG: hypothetical protein QOJ58_5928 [Alphaproteobacteria bacterium]|jgi:hypothetical protein|nr:hypothetical protein [Alphaproteobacteria bacterium]
MVFAGIKVPDTTLVLDAMELAFRYEAFRGSKTNPACPTSDKCDLSI